MEGLIFLVILIVLAVIITPIVIAASSSSKINRLSDELNTIKSYLKSIKSDIEKLAATPQLQNYTAQQQPDVKPEVEESPAIVTPTPPAIEENLPQPVSEIIEEIKEQQQEALVPEEEIEAQQAPVDIELPQTASKEEVESPEEIAAYYTQLAKETVQPVNTPPAYIPPPAAKKTNFEQFIGEKLISIVGIAILVLGIFFSVKWAIDRNLISDAGKVMIGLVAGTILIAVAHRLAKNYRAFSSILAGGGISVFYFSIYEAYQSYHLLSQTAAFIVMVLITLLAVVLSIIYDKKELAVIAIVGGFCTPFFVSNGSGNYQVLFSYLLILNIGMFALAYFKKWNLVNIICYCFTMLLFSGWVLKAFDPAIGHAGGGMLFISLFFLIFFGMNIIYNLRHRTRFGPMEISMLLSNSFIYLGFGLFFLSHIRGGYHQGMFTLSLAAFNFIFAYAFFKKQQVDKNLVYLLIGLVLTFLSLTGPLQLDGNYITLFWACELVILYWMGLKTGIALLKNASILVLFLTLISLGMDWEQDYYNVHLNKLPLIFNKVFITGLVVILAIFIKRKLIKSDAATSLLWGALPKPYYNYFTGGLLLVLIYLAGLFEVQYQSFHITQNDLFETVMLWIYQYLAPAALAFYFKKNNDQRIHKIVAGLLAFVLLLYPVANYTTIDFREGYMGSALYHWRYLLPLLALVCVVYLISYIRKYYTIRQLPFKIMAWGATAIILFIISAEAIHLWVYTAHEPGFWTGELVIRAKKVALPIIWSIASLLLMLLGMRKKLKIFRIISLSLFTLTIAKLFLYDISNVGQGGKIAAFIILGVILLVVSFMYQKIKGLFTDEEQE